MKTTRGIGRTSSDGRHRFPIGFCVLLFASTLAEPEASAQRFLRGDVMNPKSYPSASGAWTLEVDPTTRTGDAAADCRLFHMGREVWAKRLPFAFQEAGVTETGESCGYALTDLAESGDTLVMAVVDARGAIRAEHHVPQAGSRFIHGSPKPSPIGLIFEPEQDRFVVRAAEEDDHTAFEYWRVFAISTGKALRGIRPDATLQGKEEWPQLLHARSLTGTGFRLLHWRRWRVSLLSREDGAIFMLVDQDGRAVWSLTLPNDYEEPSDEKVKNSTDWAIRNRGAFLDVGADGSFALWFVQDRARVEFEARPDAAAETGWSVVETGRTPYVPENPPSQEPEPLWELSLEYTGSYELERPAATSSLFTDLETWDFASNCDFLAIDQVAKRSFVFRRLDANGDVVIEKPIDAFVEESDHIDAWARVSDAEWLVAVRNDEKVSTLLRRVNMATGAVEDEDDAIELAAGGIAPHVEGLAITGDGGCAALLAYHLQYTIRTMLTVLDAERRQRFFVPEQYEDKTKLFSPEDVAVAPNGDVVVLENIADDLKIYDSNGEYLRTIEFKSAFGEEANYPTDVRIGANGDILVGDFLGDPPLWRLAADGSLRSRVVPRTADGRLARDVVDDSRIAPYGTIWTTDGRAFLALGDDGMVERVVGVAPDATVLDEPAATVIDSAGRCLVLDERTGSLHVFRVDGSRAFVVRPDPDEILPQRGWQQLFVSDANGGVLKKRSRGIGAPHRGYVRFDESGRRDGVLPIDADLLAACPDGRFWSSPNFLDSGLILQDENGTSLRRIERLSDRRWMPNPSSAAIDPDGVLVAVIPDALVLVGPGDGDVREVEVPRSGLAGSACAATRDWVILWNDFRAKVLLHRRSDAANFSWTPPASAEDSKWTYGFSPDGRELLALDSPALVVHRFLLPPP